MDPTVCEPIFHTHTNKHSTLAGVLHKEAHLDSQDARVPIVVYTAVQSLWDWYLPPTASSPEGSITYPVWLLEKWGGEQSNSEFSLENSYTHPI